MSYTNIRGDLRWLPPCSSSISVGFCDVRQEECPLRDTRKEKKKREAAGFKGSLLLPFPFVVLEVLSLFLLVSLKQLKATLAIFIWSGFNCGGQGSRGVWWYLQRGVVFWSCLVIPRMSHSRALFNNNNKKKERRIIRNLYFLVKKKKVTVFAGV